MCRIDRDQHEIRRLQTTLWIVEEAIVSFHLVLEILRSGRACLEEDAHCVCGGWGFDNHALEREDTELDDVKGALECRGGEWGIVNHSFGLLCITIYDIQELKYKSEDDFSICVACRVIRN